MPNDPTPKPSFDSAATPTASDPASPAAPSTPDTPAPLHPPGRGKRRVWQVLGGLGVVLVLATLWGYWQWRSKPEYWVKNQAFLAQHTPEQLMTMAESVEQRLLAAVSYDPTLSDPGGQGLFSLAADTYAASVGGHGTRQLFLTVDEINAWINQRLAGWAANQGLTIPEYVAYPMIAIDDGRLILAFLVDRPSVNQVVSMAVHVAIQDGQDAILRVEDVILGQLGVPAEKWIGKAIQRGASPDYTHMIDQVTEALDGMSFDPVLKLHHQKIQLVAFQLKANGVLLTLKAPDQP